MVIVNERSLPFVTSVTVDETKTHVLTKYASKKVNKVLVESDHQSLILETAIPWKRQNSSKERKEVFQAFFRGGGALPPSPPAAFLTATLFGFPVKYPNIENA